MIFQDNFFDVLQRGLAQGQWPTDVMAYIPEQWREWPTDLDLTQFSAGVQRFQQQRVTRAQPDYEHQGTFQRARLFWCGGEGAPVLLVPSMINKAYVFDLIPGTSLIETLRVQGFSVWMLDWGDPLHEAQGLTVDKTVTEVIRPALAEVAKRSGENVHLVGYCMGGVLSLAAALGDAPLRSLALIAAPWDFAQSETHKQIQQQQAAYEALLNAAPLITAEQLQMHFFLLDPFSAIRRMMAYGQEQDQHNLARLTALESWLLDGVAMESGVARVVLFDWFRDNLPQKNRWMVAGQPVDAKQVTVPTLLAVPQNDKIVPSLSALALAGTMPRPEVMMVPAGHVGIMVGRKATERFYVPLAEWLKRY